MEPQALKLIFCPPLPPQLVGYSYIKSFGGSISAPRAWRIKQISPMPFQRFLLAGGPKRIMEYVQARRRRRGPKLSACGPAPLRWAGLVTGGWLRYGGLAPLRWAGPITVRRPRYGGPAPLRWAGPITVGCPRYGGPAPLRCAGPDTRLEFFVLNKYRARLQTLVQNISHPLADFGAANKYRARLQIVVPEKYRTRLRILECTCK